MNLFGKYFDDNEKVLNSLTKIYGIGRLTANEFGMLFGIGSHSKVKDLSKETWSRIIQAIELGSIYSQQTGVVNSREKMGNSCFSENKKLHQILCENRALAKIRANIDLAKKIKSYRGLRHLEGLPCRGQRTHTNAITVRKRR